MSHVTIVDANRGDEIAIAFLFLLFGFTTGQRCLLAVTKQSLFAFKFSILQFMMVMI